MTLPSGAVGADPAALHSHVATVRAAHDPLALALRGAVDAAHEWNRLPSSAGCRVGVDDLVALATAAEALAALDVWVARIADAFAAADAGGRPGSGVRWIDADLLDRLAPPDPPTDRAGVRWTDVVRRERSTGATPVVRLALDDLPAAVGPGEGSEVLRALGVSGSATPVHLVVHGWGTTTAGSVGAGRATAALYDEQAVEGATVLVVDWDAGAGAGGPGTLADFARAERAVGPTGRALAELLGVLAAAGVPVSVTAHSLGVAVVAEALAAVDDPSGTFGVDLLAVQPAVPAAHPGALATARVRDLTVTVNDGDDALFWYELQGPDALGDERPDGPGLGALVDVRAARGLATEVVDHDSPAGRGHLGLRADGSQGLVRSLTQEAVDRVRGDPAEQAALRRWIAATWSGPDGLADVVIDHPAVEAYLSRCQRTGEVPSRAHVRALVDVALLVPTGSPASPAGAGSR